MEPLTRRKGINTITHSPVGRGLGSPVQLEGFHPASQSPRLPVVPQQMGVGGAGPQAPSCPPPSSGKEFPPRSQVSGECAGVWCVADLQRSAAPALSLSGNCQSWQPTAPGGIRGGLAWRDGRGSSVREVGAPGRAEMKEHQLPGSRIPALPEGCLLSFSRIPGRPL